MKMREVSDNAYPPHTCSRDRPLCAKTMVSQGVFKWTTAKPAREL